MRQLSPALNKAGDHLRSVVDELRRAGKDRLPTVSVLATRSGVAPATMGKAVAVLRAAGVLRVSPRTGIQVASGTLEVRAPTEAVTPRPTRAKWEELASAISRDLLRGMHRPGVILPPTKELTGRYGACYRTLRKALHGLIGEGLLEVHGAGFRVPVLSARHSQATVVLIAGGDEIGNLLAHRPRVRENLGALEQECARSRVRLRIAPFSDRFRSPSGAELGGGSVVGYLLWSTSIPPSEVASMLRRFCAEGKPVALLDEREGVLVDAGHPGAGLVQSFTMGISPLCGRHVARHLLELGHRRVAYLSPFAQLTAGQDRRLQGLTETFAAAGLPNAVAPFTATERGSPVAVTTLPDDVSRSMEGLLRITARQTARHPAANARSSHTLRRAMVGIMHEQTFWKALAPMCRRALEENPEATAWIGYNDMTALECIDYLRSRRRRLPQDISVVGFDNTAEASYEGLTSYDFNSAAVMHEMLAHVLAPGRIRARRSPGQAVEIEGFVAERASTGPARTVAAATKSATARVSSPVG